MTMTVAQLQQFIHTSAKNKYPDKQVVVYLKKYKLTEQLTDRDHHLVGHQAVGDLGHARHRGEDVRVDVRCAELQGLIALPFHRVDREDVAGAGVDGTLQSGHTDTADTDDGDVVARPDIGGADR